MPADRRTHYGEVQTGAGLPRAVHRIRHGDRHVLREALPDQEGAGRCGIPSDSLLATIKGRRSGHNVKAAVAPVMARYEAAAKKQRRKGRGA